MRRPVPVAVAICALLAGGALVQAADGCAKFKWDVAREVAVFQQPPNSVAAGRALADAPLLETERHYTLGLQPQENVAFVTPPSKKMLSDGAFAGVLRFRVAQAGTYRVAIDSGFWLDIVQDGKSLTSIDFNGSQDCAGPHKIVVYELPANADLVLQASAASTARARLSITRVPAAKP